MYSDRLHLRPIATPDWEEHGGKNLTTKLLLDEKLKLKNWASELVKTQGPPANSEEKRLKVETG